MRALAPVSLVVAQAACAARLPALPGTTEFVRVTGESSDIRLLVNDLREAAGSSGAAPDARHAVRSEGDLLRSP